MRRRCWPPAAWRRPTSPTIKEAGLAEGLRLLAAGEVDAVITTLAAPARALQEAAATTGIKLLPLGTQERAILAAGIPTWCR